MTTKTQPDEPRFILIDLQTKQVICTMTADQAQVAFWRLDVRQPNDGAYITREDKHDGRANNGSTG